MQLRFLVTASVLHGAIIVGVGLGVHSWQSKPKPRLEVALLPAVTETSVFEDVAIVEPVEVPQDLADSEVVEPEFTPLPAPSPDPDSEEEPEEDRDQPEPVFSSPPLVKATPDLLVRIRPVAMKTPKAQPAPPAVAVAATDAVALDEQNKPPEFPPEAIRRRVEGTVVLIVIVDVKGEVKEVELLQSAGLTRWHRLLDEAAIAAIIQWRYQPATENGKAVEKRIRQPVVFGYPR